MALVRGTESTDTLNGTAGNDIFRGLEGHDVIYGLGGSDIVYGGDGNDWIAFQLGSLLAYGGQGHDVMMGSSGGGVFYGGAGHDTLYGGEGRDEIYGGTGNDQISDSIGGDVLDGGAGNDLLLFRATGVFVFNAQAPLITGTGATAVNFERINLSGDFENDDFTGGRHADTLRGWNGNDTLSGLGGDDFLIGDNGSDVLYGGNGDDYMTGGGHSDTLYGGAGNDTLRGGEIFDLFPGHDWLEGGAGADLFLGGASVSMSFASSSEGVYVDLVLGRGFGGDAQGDVYQTGAYILQGSAFDDMLVGGAYQQGGAGNDRLVQSWGTRTMSGEAGLDHFVFNINRDSIFDAVTITDFDQAVGERMNLSAIDARLAPGNQAFSFIGTADFGTNPGELRYAFSGGNTVISFRIDNTGFVHTITLVGEITLTAADFVL